MREHMHVPLGIIDSSSGGLSVWQSVVSLLPHESTVYVGDHAHAPYSKKTTSFIRARMRVLIPYLLKQKVKLIVIACNTATVAGIAAYRRQFPRIPIVGVVPVVKTASEVSRRRRFAVLSTHYTANSRYQKQLIQTYASDCTVFNIGTTSLVALIEAGHVTGKPIERCLRQALRRAREGGVDTVVLGCTHYPFLHPVIRAIVGENVRILDSGGAVARHVRRILENNKTVTTAGVPTYIFQTTGDSAAVTRVACLLTGRNILFHHVTI